MMCEIMERKRGPGLLLLLFWQKSRAITCFSTLHIHVFSELFFLAKCSYITAALTAGCKLAKEKVSSNLNMKEKTHIASSK